ncbi:MAG: prepilin-type N-terminal cleavage/methylation domain-containing protein [Pseudomonadota bacterium]
MQTPRGRSAGFSLIELMAVVTILAVLSMAAVAGYRKYSHRGRNMEAIHMLAEIGMKQAMYFSLYGQYVDTTATNPAGYANSDFYPAVITGGQKDWTISCPDDAGTYPGWCALGVRPSSKVYYQYVTGGWAPNDPTDAINMPDGVPMITDATRQWWFAVARGDIDSNGVFKTFVFTSEVNEVYTLGLTE